MNDPFAEYEAELEAQARAEIAREDAAWRALPQSERDRINAERAARLEAIADAVDAAPEEEEEEDEEDEDESDDD